MFTNQWKTQASKTKGRGHDERVYNKTSRQLKTREWHSTLLTVLKNANSNEMISPHPFISNEETVKCTVHHRNEFGAASFALYHNIGCVPFDLMTLLVIYPVERTPIQSSASQMAKVPVKDVGSESDLGSKPAWSSSLWPGIGNRCVVPYL